MLKFLNGLIMAFTMYTIVPMPYKKWEEKNFPYILVSLPFIGLFIGLLWYVISLMLFDLKKEIVYVIVMFFPLALTGFIHIDGYMDTCDAIFSRAPLEKKKQILKDPRVGAFAVIGLVFLFFIFYSSLSEILKKDISYLKTFIFIPVFSRCMTVLFIIKTKAMSDEGFIASFKKNLNNKHFFIVIFMLFFAITLSYFIC